MSADAQDLTQETFIKALQHQEQLKDEQKAAHWLSSIATNTAIDFLRRNWPRHVLRNRRGAGEPHGKSGAGAAARRASGVPGRRVAAVEPAGAAGVDVARRGRACRRRKWRAYWIVPRPRCGRTSPTRAPSCGGTWKEGSGSPMKHPSQEILALHAGGDLGWLARWRTARHRGAVASECRAEVAAFERTARGTAGTRARCPKFRGTAWRRRCGPISAWGWPPGNVCASATGPCAIRRCSPARAPHWPGQRAGADGDGRDAGAAGADGCAGSSEPVVQATANGIQRRAGDQAFGLMHSGASSVTYTVGAQGTIGARYMDPETGHVTMTKVYVE